MKQQNILQFWRNVEIFDLPDFNKKASVLHDDIVLPWLREERASVKKDWKWQYTLIFGRIEKKMIIDHIDRLLGTQDEMQDWKDPITGHTCLSALILDEEGRPDERSYVPAAYFFGIRVLQQDQNLTEVSRELDSAQADFELRYNVIEIPFSENPEEKPLKRGDVITPLHLKAETDYLGKMVSGWHELPIGVFLVAQQVPKKAQSDPELLNSFYLSDLNYLSGLEPSSYSKTLKEYLSLQTNEKNRKDIIAEKKYLLDTINPELMTAGRWPSSINYGLYTAQNGAVNTIFSEIGIQSGLRGVNGPPGTGKTTLLLDVIAEIIVRRAKVLSELGPHHIFENRYQKIEKEDGYFELTCNINKKLLNDFGIVVASNNNAAVENITKELPAKSKIDSKTFSEADYFAECSRALIEEESWGILSAALGNSKNRIAFRNAFWGTENKEQREKKGVGFKETLSAVYQDKENDKTSYYLGQFETTKDELKRLHKRFAVFKKKAGAFHTSLPLFKKNKDAKLVLESKASSLAIEIKKLEEDEKELMVQEQSNKESMDKVQVAMNFLTANKPSFFTFHKIFNSKAYRKWKSQADAYLNEYNAYLSKYNDIKKLLPKIKAKIESATSELNNVSAEIITLRKAIHSYLSQAETLHKEYGIDHKQLCDENFELLSLDEIHLRMPYYSPEIAQLRSDIFLLSLELHQYTILSNAKKIRFNLETFFKMLTGQADVTPDISENLWSTFFLCVPVVSTTLASAGRLFPNRVQNQIGWLLIDEAGQATPQSIAGSLYRSKRSIIIGDPLQVEPVVTIPTGLVFKLRKQENVESIWSPSQTSAQQLADRISVKGTYMKNGSSDIPIWTGFPLRTHRRCDDPMFTIANKIAYGGQMVKATVDEVDKEYLGKSQWFHVADENPPINKHALKDEIEELKLKIDQLQKTGYNGNIYVISPFKSVADKCNQEFHYSSQISCGTIHKFQGKEADVVFLVLGGDPKSSGARNWASEKPNMLNVALTRAKKRIYVIGNKTLWGQCSYFDVMAKTL